ncbi:unnamed protein product [Miscanthus lutarioriparius]|uniref:Uncharacterized protein n=1 Tax=Miscanthus lutarioriparius TaxID=422564 RepID=A0A811R0C2_9POAL|nr:unnamed protein product [Miscanthus lutarioriparius]
MAPPPTAACAASADPVDAESLEVRCAGCGEALEVERGLTEFICPDCATPQSLPPELMPPPPPRRKALPLPRGAADVRGARLPCGACGALLSVPVGMTRCACPLCGAELAVDTARLRHYLLSSAASADAVPVVPLGASSSEPPILQIRQAHTEHAGQFISESPESEHPESGHPDYTIDGEELHGVPDDTARYQEQRNIYPGSSRIVSAEKRHGEPISQVRHQTQDLTSSHAIRAKQSYQQNPDRVIEALQNPVNSALFSESGISKWDNSCSGKATKTWKQNKPQRRACAQLVHETIAGNDNRGRRQLIGLDVMGSERRQEQTTNGATQEVRREHSESAIRKEMGNQVTHVESEQPGSHRVHAGKRKGLVAASNSVLQLRRSKRLAKDSSAATDRQLVMDTEVIHRQNVGCQAVSPNGLMPTAIIDAEQTESEPDEQSPVHSSDLSDTNRIIDNLCNSSLPSPEFLQTCSNESENLHITTLPSPNHDMSDAEHFSSNLDMADPEDFVCTYIPLDVKRALAKQDSKSSPHHMTSQQSSGEAYLRDSMDSEGQEVQLESQRKGRRPRGLTLCLKVWTMHKGMHIPVSLNSSGQPIGKEAATLTSFLGALARDGILVPLTYHNWKLVPEKNKDAMCHIVKLKFDIAPFPKSWVVKNLAKKWRTWKFQLKQQHFDTHETEEERLADRNPRVLEEHWRFLVAYWSTEKAQALSAQNKAIQAKVTTYQTSGTKSFARRIEEEKQKWPNKDEPTVEDLFILTHTPKDGRPVMKAAADAIARRLHELRQKQSEGPKRRRGKAALKASLDEAMEAKRKAEDETAALREKLIAMEESQKKLQEATAIKKSAAGSPSRSRGPDSAQLQQAANGGANGAGPSRSRRHSRTSARRHGVPAQLGSSTTPRQRRSKPPRRGYEPRDAVSETGYMPGARHKQADNTRRDRGAS